MITTNYEIFEEVKTTIKSFDYKISEQDIFVDHPIFYTKNLNYNNKILDISKENEREEYYKSYFKILECYSLENITTTLIKKPYRMLFFLKFFNFFKNKNKIFRQIYTSSEFTGDLYNILSAIYNCCKMDNLFGEDEKEFNDFEDVITIYRGQTYAGYHIKNISWTMDPEIAEWFSKRFTGVPTVLKAKIPKKLVWFYNNDIGEKEIVLIPGVDISEYIIQ